jgi:hypothetical protein
MVNLNVLMAHRGRPLPKNGTWSSHPVPQNDILHGVCDQPHLHCTEVSYTVDLGDAKIVCLWDLVQDSSGKMNPSIFKQNREATIYFVHVRGAA